MVVVTVEMKSHVPPTRSEQGISSQIDSALPYVVLSRVGIDSPHGVRLSHHTYFVWGLATCFASLGNTFGSFWAASSSARARKNHQ
jgi:hypothetical protein